MCAVALEERSHKAASYLDRITLSSQLAQQEFAHVGADEIVQEIFAPARPRDPLHPAAYQPDAGQRVATTGPNKKLVERRSILGRNRTFPIEESVVGLGDLGIPIVGTRRSWRYLERNKPCHVPSAASNGDFCNVAFQIDHE